MYDENSHIGLEWCEQFAYECYHVTESVMRNLARPRKPGKSIAFHGHALHKEVDDESKQKISPSHGTEVAEG